ncbi:MAG: DNA alkylation repair protein [Reichenbachiella sp.]|uniref:DNA alkylation repair protein n=1 Tax=Reichenbachiella sp. TaxID=2184521 RepID=UPI00329A566C
MPEPLKNEFNEAFVTKLGDELARKDESFNLDGFVRSTINENWEVRELKDRMRHITHMIHAHTSLDYLSQLPIVVDIAAQFSGLRGMTFPDYVEVYGLDHPKESLKALYELTKYSSSEFAIRPFILAFEKEVMKEMLQWSKDENEHVRRLASEGCRPRLPWAMALPAFKKDSSLVLPILENLKSDESLYVRKSVANNINDITKDHPEVALNLCANWYGANDHTDWIVKHGLRNMLKKGNAKALQIIGFDDKAKFEVSELQLSEKEVKMGGSFNFEFQISNLESKLAFAKVGFVVSYQKSNGSLSDKIFHVTEKEFASDDSAKFNKKLSFRDLTTRKHHPGLHKIGVLVNGKKLAEEEFELV